MTQYDLWMFILYLLMWSGICIGIGSALARHYPWTAYHSINDMTKALDDWKKETGLQ